MEKHFSSKPTFTLVLLTQQVQQNELFCVSPPSCLAFAIYLKHCILGSTYVRSIVISFLTHRSAHIFILHPHSHELQYPISILLCLSIVVDCQVDIESSLSCHSLSANHQLNDILPPIDLHILILNTVTFPYGLQYPTVYLLCDAIS